MTNKKRSIYTVDGQEMVVKTPTEGDFLFEVKGDIKARNFIGLSIDPGEFEGIIPVEKGGTGRDTLEQDKILVGNGTSQVQLLDREGIDTRSTFPSSPHIHQWSDIQNKPAGSDGQSYFFDNLGDISPSFTLINGRFVSSEEELLEEQSVVVDQSEIFNNWYRFSHSGSNFPSNPSETDAWSYDNINDEVKSSVNSVTHIGFVSQRSYTKFTIEVTIGATAGDNDIIGVLLGFYRDQSNLVPNNAYNLNPSNFSWDIDTTSPQIPREHSLTLVRSRTTQSLSEVQGTLTQFGIAYDLKLPTEELLANGHELVTQTNSTYNGANCRIRVERDGDIIRAWTTEWSDAPGYDPNQFIGPIEVDLSSSLSLSKFRQPSPYGFTTFSQDNAFFRDIDFIDATGRIFDLSNDTSFEQDSATWIDTGESAAEIFGKGKFYYSERFKRLYYENDFEIIEIDLGTSGGDPLPTNISINRNATTVTVESSSGNNGDIPAATATLAGVMTSTDKNNLTTLMNGSISAGTNITISGTWPNYTINSTGGGGDPLPTNISINRNATTVTVESSSGDDGTIPSATATLAGVMTAADKIKLDGIEANATANTGTVTSVGISVPTGLSVSNSPITSSGTISLNYTSGYAIPTTAKQTEWDTAFGWGDHSGQYLGRSVETWQTSADSIQRIFFTSGGNTRFKTGSGFEFLNSSNIVIGSLSSLGALTLPGPVSLTSDSRVKTDLTQIENALEKVSNITGYEYTRTDTGSREVGVLAQDVLEVEPLLVNGGEKGSLYSVSYSNMVALLIEAIKDLKVEIEELKNKGSG